MARTHQTLVSLFDDIADAIREKDGTSAEIVADTFPERIEAIQVGPDTSDATAVAGDILKDKTAYVKGSKITGTMPNQGAKTQTLTSQGASYTIPAGYHNGSGKVTANLTASTLDNTMISGESVEEATGDYGYKVTVAVPAGYHNSQSVTKTFSSLFPAPDTPGTADKMLAGYKLYDGDGKLITGTMPNNGATGTTITTQGGTYSIPSGYTSGGTVTANINNGVITSGAGTASATTTVAPGNVTIAKTTDGNASTGTVTTTKPTSGYYVATKATAAANTTGATSSITGTVAAPTVGTAGYVSSSAGTKNTNTVSGTATAKTSAKDSSVTYIPITSGAVSASDSSISGGSFTPTLTYDSTNDNFKFGGSKAASGTAYAKITTDGYLTSGSNTSKSLSATVSATGSVDKVATGATITGTTTKAPTLARTAKPSGDTWVDAASGAATTTKPTSGPYVQIDAAANTGTLTATPKVTSAGYGDTTNYGSTAATATVGASKATTAYVPIKTGSATTPATTVAPGAMSISIDSAGKITASTATNSKSVTPTVSAGWVASGTAGTVSVSAQSGTKQLTTQAAKTVTPSTSSQTAVASGVYTTGAVTVAAMPSGALSAGSGSASATGTNITLGTATTTKPSSGAYITATGSGSASVGTAGYLASGTSKTSNTATTYYPVSNATITNNTSGGTSSGTINAGKQIKIGKGWNNSDVYYQAEAARGTDKAAATYNTSTSDQTIAAGYYLTGAQTIKAVTTSNISAANIKAGITVKVGDANNAGRIASVAGTFTSDANATAGDIANGKTAYVNGVKITGTSTASNIIAVPYTEDNLHYIGAYGAGGGGSVADGLWATVGASVSGSSLTLG